MPKAEEFINQIVTVKSGPHKGKTGYCDDSEDAKAVVYFKGYGDGYNTIPGRCLTIADEVTARRHATKYMSIERWYRGL